MPQKILDRLLPVLAKADPEEFKFPVAKVAKNPARLPDGKSIDFFSTTFEPTIGKIYRLTVTRDGEVSYLNINRSLIGRADISNVTKYWTICKKDAAILLDGLVEDGLLRGAPDGGEATKLAQYETCCVYGRWELKTKNSLPAKAIQRLIPLLEEGKK